MTISHKKNYFSFFSHITVLFFPVMFFILSGCKSTSDWRDEADERASFYLSAAQKTVTGREEELVIETPGDTLRRRLLLDQNLTVFNEASLGIRDLPDSEYWEGDKRLKAAEDVGIAFNTTLVVLMSELPSILLTFCI